MICGINAAGKSTLVGEFVAKHYQRINRDTTGGNLEGQVEIAADVLNNDGVDLVVLDNTYATKQSRASLIQLAKDVGAKISCWWLTTSLEEAQMNVCLRMIRKYGHLPGPEHFKKLKDPNAFPPAALFHYRKTFEKPSTEEGFDEVIEVPFTRAWPNEYRNKAVIFDYDQTLRDSAGAREYPTRIEEVLPRMQMAGVIEDFKQRRYILLGASNQSGIAKGILTDEMARKCFEETNRRLGAEGLDFMYCPHKIPPVSCYCRKPHVGIGAHFIEKYKLCPSQCIMVGDQTTDESFAERCGFQYINVNEIK
jgi:HAD superfamily hydrolase (TIGR01662 family)